MISAHRAIKQAEARARAAIPIAQSKFQVLPTKEHPPLAKNATPGEIMQAMAGRQTMNPIRDCARIRHSVHESFFDIEKSLQPAHEAGLDLDHISDFVVGKRSVLPTNLDPSVAAAATTLRTAHLAGLTDATALSATIKRDSMSGLSTLAEFKGKALPVFAATARIAALKGAVRYLNQCADHAPADRALKFKALAQAYREANDGNYAAHRALRSKNHG